MANKDKNKKRKTRDNRFKYEIGDEVLAKDLYTDTNEDSYSEIYTAKIVSRNISKYGNIYVLCPEPEDLRGTYVLRENQILGFATIK